MASTLKKQINLQQTGTNNYTAGWHVDWTLGSSKANLRCDLSYSDLAADI